ncbi:MAG: phosphoribosylaminoimidazole carboxylase [Methyloprofundus sp.]|nr:phosphoribosylaminoimidazole carboxylase [Methyloprofundus sp.]
MKVKNILAEIPEQLSNELFSTLLQNPQIKIERIVSKGQCDAKDKWYDQETDEWVILLQGAAILEFAEPHEMKRLKSGDYLLIPAHKKHRVDWTDFQQESIWLAIHFAK